MSALDDAMAALRRGLTASFEEREGPLLELMKLREAHESLRSTVGTRATAEALRALESAEETILAAKKRRVADAVAAVCRDFGVRVTPGAPFRRAKAKKKKPAVAAQTDVRPREEGGR